MSWCDSRKVRPESLRVCHITSGDLLGGAEVVLLNLARASSKDILRQTLFVLFNQGVFSRKLIQTGARVSLFQEKGFPSDLTTVFQVARLLKDEGSHVVHTHGYKSNVIGGLASRLSGCPVLIRTEHSRATGILKHAFSRATVFRLLDYFIGAYWTDKIVAVSSDLAKTLAQRYPSEKVITIFNGVVLHEVKGQCQSSNVKSELGIPRESDLVGMFSRLNPEKGVAIFLKAASIVRLKAPHVRFLIVGNGPLYAELKKETFRLNLEKHVIFAGFREDALDLVCQMDVVVLSSVHEGMPMILLEAMALAKAVVATKVGGIPEVIDDRRTGLLVQPEDDYTLAMACVELLENRPLAKQLGLRARKEIAKRFTAQMMVAKLRALYWEVFSGKAMRSQTRKVLISG